MRPLPGELRRLNGRESAVLKKVLSLADFPGRQELEEQADHVVVAGGQPLLLDLVVLAEIAAAAIRSGPIPTRAIVLDADGSPAGEVIVWVTDGYLSGLEYAWFTEEAPSSFPEPERIADI